MELARFASSDHAASRRATLLAVAKGNLEGAWTTAVAKGNSESAKANDGIALIENRLTVIEERWSLRMERALQVVMSSKRSPQMTYKGCQSTHT